MQHNRSDEKVPNRASEMEKAEGSRDTAQQSGAGEATRNRSESDRSGDRSDAGDATGGGITNRDLEREQAEQEHLPPRGGRREDQ